MIHPPTYNNPSRGCSAAKLLSLPFIMTLLAVLVVAVIMVHADKPNVETHIATPTTQNPAFHFSVIKNMIGIAPDVGVADARVGSGDADYTFQIQLTGIDTLPEIPYINCAFADAATMISIARIHSTPLPDKDDPTSITLTRPFALPSKWSSVYFVECSVFLNKNNPLFGDNTAVKAAMSVKLIENFVGVVTTYTMFSSPITYATIFSQAQGSAALRRAPLLEDVASAEHSIQPSLLPTVEFAQLKDPNVHPNFDHMFAGSVKDLSTAFTRLAWTIAVDSMKNATALLDTARVNNAIKLDFIGSGWFNTNTNSTTTLPGAQPYCAVNNVLIPAFIDHEDLQSSIILSFDKIIDPQSGQLLDDPIYHNHRGDDTGAYKNPYAKAFLSAAHLSNSPTYKRTGSTSSSYEEPRAVYDYLTIHCFDFFPVIFSTTTTIPTGFEIPPLPVIRMTFGAYTPAKESGDDLRTPAQFTPDVALGVADVEYNQNLQLDLPIPTERSQPVIGANHIASWGGVLPPSSIAFNPTTTFNKTNVESFDTIQCTAPFTMLTKRTAEEFTPSPTDTQSGPTQKDTLVITIPIAFLPAQKGKHFVNRLKTKTEKNNDDQHNATVLSASSASSAVSSPSLSSSEPTTNSYIIISAGIPRTADTMNTTQDLYIIPQWEVHDNYIQTAVEINTAEFYMKIANNTDIFTSTDAPLLAAQVFVFGQLLTLPTTNQPDLSTTQCLFEYTHGKHAKNTKSITTFTLSPLPVQYLHNHLTAVTTTPTEVQVVFNHVDDKVLDGTTEIDTTKHNDGDDKTHLPGGVNVRVINHNNWSTPAALTTYLSLPRAIIPEINGANSAQAVLRANATTQGVEVQYTASQTPNGGHRHNQVTIAATSNTTHLATADISQLALSLHYNRPGLNNTATQLRFAKSTMREGLSQHDLNTIFSHTPWVLTTVVEQVNTIDGFKESIVVQTPFNHRQLQAIPSTQGLRPLYAEAFDGSDDVSDDDKTKLFIIIGASVGVGLLLIICLLCCCSSNKKQKHNGVITDLSQGLINEQSDSV